VVLPSPPDERLIFEQLDLKPHAAQPMLAAAMSSIDPVTSQPSTPSPPRFITRASEDREAVARPRKDREVTRTERLDAVRTASRAYATLREGERELHFEATDTGMRIEVYDGNGRLVRAIPPNAEMAAALSPEEWIEWQA
jgi:hypothetical protein